MFILGIIALRFWFVATIEDYTLRNGGLLEP